MVKYLGLFDLAFTLYTLVECAMRDESQIKRLPKWGWLLIILFAQSIGGIAYFVLGRLGPMGGGSKMKRPKPRILPPDDDPDFLKRL